MTSELVSLSGTHLFQTEIHGCPDCGKRYSTSSNLARHRQTHRSLGDKKARRCPHCDKVYVSMPAFSMHVRTHNQGCKCPYCGKCFSRPWLLQGHIRTHTGTFFISPIRRTQSKKFLWCWQWMLYIEEFIFERSGDPIPHFWRLCDKQFQPTQLLTQKKHAYLYRQSWHW